VLFDLKEDTPDVSPATAPLVPDATPIQMTGFQQIATLAARRPSRVSRWFWTITTALLTFVVSLAAFDYITGLIARSPILGGIASVLAALFILILAFIALRELAAFSRLKRIDLIQNAATDALATSDLNAVRAVMLDINRLYMHREDTQWGRDRLADHAKNILDADGLIGAAETDLLAPIDRAAIQQIETAARQVATVTALVPLALADVFTALTANLRMIRRIAELYGGRSGTLGNWRLTRTVLSHLVATGAVAVGDDLIGSVAGGGILSKVSRRFGEGMINGALTARVGVAAIEVCRPLPFHATKRPSVTMIVKNSLTGLFSSRD
jgi:putative membrane protein